MLPSSGYFRSLTCPFFKSGFCERPHCHFRHVAEPTPSSSQQPAPNVEPIPGNTVAPAVAAPAPAPAAPAAALPVDSTLLQEMVSRAVREALQSGAAGALNTDAIAASLSAAPLPQPAPQPEPEPEPKPERRARKHRVFTIPASVSYKPTPLRDLERRRSTAEPRFSDDEDDGSDETPTSAATLAASAAEETAKESETSSKTAQAAETAPTPATTAEESTSKESEEFDLLEQIMAESSKPIQMTSTLRRRLRARPVVFRAAATRTDGDETYEPAGGEPVDADSTPVYRPTRKADSAGDGGGSVGADGPAAAEKSIVAIDKSSGVELQRSAEGRTITTSETAGASCGVTKSADVVKEAASADSLERHLNSDKDKDNSKQVSVSSGNSEYSSMNGFSVSSMKSESVVVKPDPDGAGSTADRALTVNGSAPCPSEPPTDASAARKRSHTSSEGDERPSKRRHSDSGRASGERDRSRHDSKHRDKHRSSKERERDKHSSKERDKHRSKERDKHSSKERDKHSSKERDKHSSKERDKHSSTKDRDSQKSSKESDKHSSSKDRDKHRSSSKDRDKRSSSTHHKSHSNDGDKSRSRSSTEGDGKSVHSSKSREGAKSDRHQDKSKSSHSSSGEERSKNKEHRSLSHSRKDKSSSSKDLEKSSSSKTRDGKSGHKSSTGDSHRTSSSSGSKEMKRSSSRDAGRPGEPPTRPGPSSDDLAEPGPSQPAKSSFDSTGGRSGSGSPLPDLSALEELPDMWEYPEGLLQPSDVDSDSDDSDGEDTLAECERMFNEYKAPADGPQLTAALNKARALQEKAAKEAEKSSTEVVGKKRVAHTAGLDQPSRPAPRVAPKVTPAQAMHARWQKLAEMQQQRIAQLEEQQRQREAENSRLPPLLPQPPVPKRRRVAHVPNVGALLKPPVASPAATPATSSASPAKTVTPAQTAPRGGKRLAHTPTTASVARPKIPADLGGKVPTAIRQRYLDHFCTELLKVYPGDEAQAYKKALEEEQVVYSRSPSRRVYVNLSVGAVKRLRDAAALKSTSQNGGVPVANRTVSHLDVLAGRGGTTGSWSIERTKKADETWTAAELYSRMTKHVLTEEQLEKNGFPRPDPLGRPGRAHLAHVDSRARITRAGATYRECIRCARTYEVSAEGRQVVPNSCAYHWGRPYTFRGVTKYRCCNMVAPAEPCCDADCHVSDNFDPDNLIGYMATMEKPDPEDGDHGVFALDCEMSYTTQGCELTRVTVVNAQGDTVYETIVKPDNPIIDFNTRFSGIKESDMEGVTVTIRDVQAVLLNMFSNKTILIGHSLESDFKALKLIHPTVADTSVVFPHKNGPPFKRGLKMLCQEYLKRFIQDDVGGHDSAEDAISAMDLMMWRLREDAKLMR
ncbi:RNA exonuclease 1 homolog isoform X2 [Amphibalanus amphitrite]|uniref:RNA exonuclease 1 homolog isoform X2 n=1 Tax=Amphibalanus amphitrite TaxID=1232801 RepID=UPI001C921FDD|nr:RNA exonuclease 1 homolog isoform X2 [Amphibalanus amphitrite]XP_043234574.1 RNA exonuclease 1 homolog isoform X2 [Amphibalanus amphitrite]